MRFIILLSFVFLFAACSNDNKSDSNSEENIDSLLSTYKKAAKINMHLDTLSKEFTHPSWDNPDSAAYSFKYDFFKFTAPNQKVSDKMNLVIYDLMADNNFLEPLDSNDYNNAASKLISQFNKTKYENPDASFKWELESKIKTIFYREPVISFEIEKTGKVQNQNYNNKFLLNFNIKTGSIIRIEDILKEGKYPEFLEIAEETFRKLHNIPAEATWSQTNFVMWSDGFKLNGNFAITETGLYYHFNPLDITLTALIC
jgi:hypothetical protein